LYTKRSSLDLYIQIYREPEDLIASFFEKLSTILMKPRKKSSLAPF